ncbi:MAG: hypothetical protein ACQERN_09245 [Thermodesulfobacteriota bacterium]
MAPADNNGSPIEKFDLNQMRREIEDDLASESVDFRQESDISQAVITKLMMENIEKKKGPNA